MEEPNFWDNPEEAQEQMKRLSSMKEDRDTYQKLVSAKEDMETLIEMGQEEDDDSVVPEIAEMMEEFKASFDAIRIKTLLSGEFDKDNAIIKLNAGVRLVRHAVPYVHQVGRTQRLYDRGTRLSGR